MSRLMGSSASFSTVRVNDPPPESTSTSIAWWAVMAALAELAASEGTDFDRLFLQLMITHHEGAVKMVEELLEQLVSYDRIVEGTERILQVAHGLGMTLHRLLWIERFEELRQVAQLLGFDSHAMQFRLGQLVPASSCLVQLARTAVEQGREVLALPGDLDRATSDRRRLLWPPRSPLRQPKSGDLHPGKSG